MRSLVLTLLTVVLCACAAQPTNVQRGGVQNAVYVVGENELAATAAVETKDASTNEQGSALKRLYVFFVRR